MFILILNPILKKIENKDYKINNDKKEKRKKTIKKILLIPIIFLGSMIIATLLELIASYICEALIGSWPWQTYLDYTYNFEGRIALSPSLRFGLGGVIFLYILQPIFGKLTNKLNPKDVSYLSKLVMFILLLDMCYTFILK